MKVRRWGNSSELVGPRKISLKMIDLVSTSQVFRDDVSPDESNLLFGVSF